MQIVVLLTVLLMAPSFLMAESRVENVWGAPKLASNIGVNVDWLFNIILWLTGVVFFATQALLVWFCVKYRKQKGVKASFSHGNNFAEIVWTTTPAVIFVGLFIYSRHVWNEFHVPAPSNALKIEIVGEQYGWNIRYAGKDNVLGKASDKAMNKENKLGLDKTDPAAADDFECYNDMVIPVDRPVHIVMRSRDVIHAFYVPEFRLYQDMVPGRTIEWVWFIPTRKGNFTLACSQLCGTGHYNMQGKLDVVTAEEFEKFSAARAPKPVAQTAPATPVTTVR
ncbi:MAG: cytochrome c oxidase subunit II [Verrucomicrobiae bacterium]|nr:cytochrome c oxidase subunit II [Verrucomicrobiae bacterium]